MSKHSDQYIENACKALSLLDVHIAVYLGTAKLKRGAAKAAKDAGAKGEVARLWVNVLGSQQKKLKIVVASYAAIRTYLYANTLPFAPETGGQKRGPRLLPVVRVPEVYSKLTVLSADAEEKLAAFLEEYDRFVAISMSEDMGEWRKELQSGSKLPSVEEVRNRFRCVISPPRPIPNNASGVKKFGLPIGMAAEFSSQHYDAVDGQLKQAKALAIKEAQDHMKIVEDKLSASGTTVNKAGVTVPQARLHESLIIHSKRVASMLRDMVMGYDNDPRLLALADEIDSRIANVKSVEVWKTNVGKRESALDAARNVHKSLAAYKHSQVSATPPAAKPKPTISKVTPKGGKGRKRRSSGIVGRKSRKAAAAAQTSA